MYINPTTFRRWWDLFRTDAPLTEIRLIGSNGKIASGYFYDCETALKCIQEYRDESKGLYACLNVIDSSCDGCSQRDKIIDNPKVTTNDKDIKGRIWVLIDIDTDRKSDSNATDAQVKEARDMVRQIGIFLRDQGFSSPIVAMSANGYHMYYRVNIACNEETDKVIADFLAVLEMRFGTDTCHVDLSVKNRSRVAKIIGSKSNKGSDTIDRPQRESYFEKVPEDIEPTDIAFFRKVASYLPQEETPSRHNNYSTEAFDLDGFISKHGLRVARIMPFQGGQRYILEECPFCSDHKAPDAALFKMQSGAVGFKCLHNSCSHNSWRDVRILFEPDAYTKREYDEFKSRQDYYSTAPKQAPTILKESAEKGKKWLSMTDIAWVDPSQFTYIPTGFEEIDRKMGGMCLGDVTVLTGRPGCVDRNTEFFNGTEWKKICDYQDGDMVLQYNRDGSAELVYPQAYIKEPCNHMTLIKTKYGVNQCVSDEHRLVYESDKGIFYIKTMDEVRKIHESLNKGFCGKFLTSFSYSGQGIDLTDDEIRVMCAVVCDSSFACKRSNKNICRINIKKQRKKERLEMLLSNAGIPYRKEQYNPKDPEFSNYFFEAPRRAKEFGAFWYGCNRHQLEVFCDEICHWDGHFYEKGMQFSTVVKATADFVQFAFSAIGMRARVAVNNRVGRPYLTNGKTYTRKSLEYLVHITKVTKLSIHKTGGKGNLIDVVPDDGYKYCFTVPSSMLVLRREGCINITGNCGKTSILNSITLNAIQRGYKVAVWSGELQASRFQSWIDQVAAGINGVEKYKDWWVCKRDVAQKIHQWLNGKLWLRNNAYKNKWSQLKQDIIDCVTENGTQLVILDNLASMNLDNVEGAKNDKQSVFIAELKEFAKESNIHIVIVIHPRKDIGNGLMRLESISGAADLYGLCDNVLLLHRVCQDFERRGKEFWGAEEMARLMVYHEIVEVAKNRSHGLLDDKFGLYFIEKTRAFKSSPDDAVPYGWADDNTEQREPHYNQESREVDDPLDPFSNPPSVIPF